MEHIGEREDKGQFDFIELSEREVAFVELAVAQTGIKNVVDEVGDANWRRFFKRP